MDKNSKYSTIALSFLMVTALAVGGAFYFTNNKISADVETSQLSLQTEETYPLKIGWNEISGLNTIVTVNSIYIVDTQGTYTFQEAVNGGIIEKVKLKEGNKELGKDLDYVPLKQPFLIYCKNIENTPKLLVK